MVFEALHGVEISFSLAFESFLNGGFFFHGLLFLFCPITQEEITVVITTHIIKPIEVPGNDGNNGIVIKKHEPNFIELLTHTK